MNLKSHQLDVRTPAQARAAAVQCREQAIRNSAHLPVNEGIIISFALTPEEPSRATLAELFASESPIIEVRFGSTTIPKPGSPVALPESDHRLQPYRNLR